MGSRISYANVVSTLAVFLALGGGAWAAGGGLVSSSGKVQACVPRGGGVLKVVRPNARCKSGDVAVALLQSSAPGPAGPRGLQGEPGMQGERGSTGPRGPAGPERSGPGAYSFSMGPMSDEIEQTISASFAGDQLRLNCGGGKCLVQVAATSVGEIFATDSFGASNAEITSGHAFATETPAVATIASIEGPNEESEGRATVGLSSGTAWRVDVDLITDSTGGFGSVRLVGTAIPADIVTSTACTGGACL
jgi:hypothetical protein